VIDIRYRVPSIIIIVLLCVVIEAVLLYLCITARAQDRSAFIAAASAWGLAIVGIAVPWANAASRKKAKSRKKRQAAYAEFLSLSDQSVRAQSSLSDARAAFEAASSQLDAAQEQAELCPNDEYNIIAATVDAKQAKARDRMNSASENVQKVLEKLSAAETGVRQLAPSSVLSAFERFRECPPHDTQARNSARSSFVKAARADLEIPPRADESAL
jgi:hypothetical protein